MVLLMLSNQDHGTITAAAKAVGKDNLGVAVYPTVNIGGQDVQQKAFMGVKTLRS